MTTIIAWMLALGGVASGSLQWPLLRSWPRSHRWLWVGAAGALVTLVVGFGTSLALGVGGAFVGGLAGAAVLIIGSATTIDSILSGGVNAPPRN